MTKVLVGLVGWSAPQFCWTVYVKMTRNPREPHMATVAPEDAVEHEKIWMERRYSDLRCADLGEISPSIGGVAPTISMDSMEAHPFIAIISMTYD